MKSVLNPLLYALLAFVLFLSSLGTLGFLGPDEPRYAAVAREMMRSGDYITPRLFGEPWFEKPPLYYWLAALFFQVEINETTARLPSALAAIAFLALWYWFSERRFGAPTARLAVVILASTVGWIGFARAAAMDMLLTATLDAALVFLASWFWERERRDLYVFYILLALAALAKGPVAIALAGMIAVAYLATFRDWAAVKMLLYTPALGLFFAIAAPWYVLCYVRNGYAFIEKFILEHNLGRFVSPEIGHPQPVWFYVPILLAGLFPWSALLILPVLDTIRSGLRQLLKDRERAFLFYWTVLPFVFFSSSRNKLPGYLLPILPPLTLWAARSLLSSAEAFSRNVGSPEARKRVTGRSLVPALIGVSALGLLLIPFLIPLIPDSLATGLGAALPGWNLAAAWLQVIHGPVPAAVGGMLLFLACVALFQVWNRELVGGAFAVLLGMALCVFALNGYISPSINRVATVRSVVLRIRSLGVPADKVATYHIHRNQQFQLNFYLDRSLPEWSPASTSQQTDVVVAHQGEQITGAFPVALFPGQQIRLWIVNQSRERK